MLDPTAVVLAFGEACAAGDGDAAAAQCSVAGLTGPGDTGERFFRQAARKGFSLRPVVPAWLAEGRAVVAALVLVPARSGPVGVAFVLLVVEGGAWRIEAIVKEVHRAGAFVQGWLGALTRWEDLPPFPPAEAVWQGILAEIPEDLPADFDARGAFIDELREIGPVPFAHLGTRGLPALGRGAVGVRLERSDRPLPDERWVLVDVGPTGPVFRRVVGQAAPEDLVLGVPIPWATFARGAEPPMPPAAAADPEALATFRAQARAILTDALGDALTGLDDAPGDRP